MYENHEQQDQQNENQQPVDQQAVQQKDSAPQIQQVEDSAPKQPVEAPKKSSEPVLPPNATSADLRRWLKEVEARELAEKRKAAAKAQRERASKHREQVRPARSKVVELLYAYYLVPPIENDRTESKRVKQLLGKLGLPDQAISQPTFDLVEAVKLDMHVATTEEPEIAGDQ